MSYHKKKLYLEISKYTYILKYKLKKERKIEGVKRATYHHSLLELYLLINYISLLCFLFHFYYTGIFCLYQNIPRFFSVVIININLTNKKFFIILTFCGLVRLFISKIIHLYLVHPHYEIKLRKNCNLQQQY